MLYPAAGWLQFALGNLLQFSMSQSYSPLQKRWEIEWAERIPTADADIKFHR
jgi:hypothetical protein